jgi:8-oxo-dGTP diphosphatase
MEIEYTLKIKEPDMKVTCAILIQNGLIYCAQRSENMPLPLKWEFPGGKLERGESEVDCIRREIREELGIETEVLRRLTPNVHWVSEQKIIELIPFVARQVDEVPIRLKEHLQGKWLRRKELIGLDWADADIAIVREVMGMDFTDVAHSPL